MIFVVLAGNARSRPPFSNRTAPEEASISTTCGVEMLFGSKVSASAAAGSRANAVKKASRQATSLFKFNRSFPG